MRPGPGILWGPKGPSAFYEETSTFTGVVREFRKYVNTPNAASPLFLACPPVMTSHACDVIAGGPAGENQSCGFRGELRCFLFF